MCFPHVCGKYYQQKMPSIQKTTFERGKTQTKHLRRRTHLTCNIIYIYIFFSLSLSPSLSLCLSISLSLCLSLSIKNNGDIHTHSINVYTLVLQEPLRFCSSPSTPQNHPSKVELEQGYAYRNETVYSMIFHLIAPKARLITSFC